MLIFQSVPFDKLSLLQLHEILRLRAEVFILEQDCAYQDIDNLDPKAWHVMGTDENGKLLAYARYFDRNVVYTDHLCLGRIITRDSIRGKGGGKQLMEFTINACIDTFGKGSIKISAQSHLRGFYELFGFKSVGDGYLEDGIPHHAMIRKSD